MLWKSKELCEEIVRPDKRVTFRCESEIRGMKIDENSNSNLADFFVVW